MNSAELQELIAKFLLTRRMCVFVYVHDFYLNKPIESMCDGSLQLDSGGGCHVAD